jgi:hypothetical protein
MRLPLFAFPLAALGALCACSAFGPEQEVRVLLPAPPVHWQIAFPRLAFSVKARDSRGSQQEVIVQDWRHAVQIECARALNEPILAWPFVGDGAPPAGVCPGVLRPAGGLFPLCLRDFDGAVVVELTWEGGASALVVDRVAAAGGDVSRFNAARLCAYLQKEADPWLVDLDSVAQKIAQGDFTAWDIDPLPARDARASVGPGSWFLESPFALPTTAQDGVVAMGGVPRGSHRLFSLAGFCWRLEIGEGEPLLFPGP